MNARDLPTKMMDQVRTAPPGGVWTAADFVTLGTRDAIDKALQRLVRADQLRRIDRGLYDRPRISALTKRAASPDYRAVLDALVRRDQVRMLVDGLTAANDLGLTDAVPARVVVHTDARRRSVKMGALVIDFRQTAPSRLYWAGRPAMRVVQALHWLKDTLPGDLDRVTRRLNRILADPKKGPSIREDLVAGFRTLPTWMQPLIRDLIEDEGATSGSSGSSARATRPPGTRSRARPAAKRARA